MAGSTVRATQRPRAWRGRSALAAAAVLVGASLFTPTSAQASHPEASLPGSNFEIDVNANLKVDDAAPSIDWGSVNETRKSDVATGQNDDSYAGGTKEDDACPGTTTGSIPNNKSDLLTFGAYVESEAGGPGFLNLFWNRVQEPSGTTLMDFELNQSSTDCGNGVNPVRTVGDLLIEYKIEQGGATANIKVRKWTGTAWGPEAELTSLVPPLAAGTINSSAISAAESDGLSTTNPISARTFGEAQLDLDFVFDSGKCESFGSAFLKSRASDSFTSQLKDFIRPVPVNITNCGSVVIHKVTDPASDPTTTRFGFTKSFSTDPASPNTFTLGHGQFTGDLFVGNVLFGTGYTVTEDSLPAGWDFASIDCNVAAHPSVGVTFSISGTTITFDIDNAADRLDCTYTNRARGTIIVEKVTNDGSGSFGFTSNTLPPAPFTLTTTAPGQAGKDSDTFANLVPGTYDVAETVPAGWNLVSASCSDGSDPAAIGLSAGETVTCTFVDEREKGAIKITKTRKHAADGPGDHPHAGVVFTVTGGELSAGGITATTDANGVACVSGLVLSSFVGNYTVTEIVPAGYQADSTNPQTVSVNIEATCGDGNEATASFHNTPQTDLSVSVDSQVNGGTASTIECRDANGNVVASGSTSGNGDGSAAAGNLRPGTYTCTIVIDP